MGHGSLDQTCWVNYNCGSLIKQSLHTGKRWNWVNWVKTWLNTTAGKVGRPISVSTGTSRKGVNYEYGLSWEEAPRTSKR